MIVSQHLAKFSGHTHCGRGDVISLVCYLILQSHVTKESLLEDDFQVKSSSCEIW